MDIKSNSSDLKCILWLTKEEHLNCDEHRLVESAQNKFVNIELWQVDTLDDIALFHAWNKTCYELSNPNRLGYESNIMYVVNPFSFSWTKFLHVVWILVKKRTKNWKGKAYAHAD